MLWPEEDLSTFATKWFICVIDMTVGRMFSSSYLPTLLCDIHQYLQTKVIKRRMVPVSTEPLPAWFSGKVLQPWQCFNPDFQLSGEMEVLGDTHTPYSTGVAVSVPKRDQSPETLCELWQASVVTTTITGSLHSPSPSRTMHTPLPSLLSNQHHVCAQRLATGLRSPSNAVGTTWKSYWENNPGKFKP